MTALVRALAGAALFAVTYFDAHNHITGVLPYQAYANLPAYIHGLSAPGHPVGFDDRLALYRYLDDTWYRQRGAALDDRLFSPADGQRFALGARGALVVYKGEVAGSASALDGTLERVLTATPWTEFDSAYAFRGGPAGAYLRDRFYGGSDERLNADLCKATILELARTHIDASEQSLPFVGGWRFDRGTSGALETIECVLRAPADAGLRAALSAAHERLPSIKIVLMTHTAQLAALANVTSYSEWSRSGACSSVALPRALVTPPKAVYDGLMGWSQGKAVVPAGEARRYFDDVVGIDTAAPETTCFTPQGMTQYEELIGAVYRASKARRRAGWHGKLLVHTHAGEGAVIDYAPSPPPQPWTFESLFAQLPPARRNAAQARANVSMLLGAIGDFERRHPDARTYVVFRLAHATWATPEQAQRMHDEGVEADVNLESNVATGAYPISRMPIGSDAVLGRIGPLARDPATNFELNDLLGALVTDPADPQQVGDVLGAASLRHLLEAHVLCLLGTDAGGVEHSDIVKEYEYAGALIAYWNRSDAAFRARFGGTGVATLFDDVRRHLGDMASDSAPAY